MLVIILITILILLITQNYLYKNYSLLENLDNKTKDEDKEEYQPYKSLKNDQKNGPLFLALKNAANISALHSQISGIHKLKDRLGDVEHKVDLNGKALTNLTNHLNKLGKSISKKPK